MAPTKKIFIIGLIIFASLLFFSFSQKVQAQSCDGGNGSCEYLSNCPSGCDGGTDICDANNGETCCAYSVQPSCASGFCGDGIANGTEDCDGGDFQGQQCTDFLDSSGNSYTGGNISCSGSCAFNLSGCTSGGDGGYTGGFPETNPGGTGNNGTSGTQVTSGMYGAVYIPGSEVGLPAPQGGIAAVLVNLLTWAIFIFGIVAMIGFVISGIQYVVAAGSESVIESAKRNMTYSIIGVIVALSGFIIIKAVYAALTATPIF